MPRIKQTRGKAFSEAEPYLKTCRDVVVLGPLSRTWYSDEGTMVEIIELLSHYGIEPHVVAGSPFCMTASAAAVLCHAALALVNERSPEAQSQIQSAELAVVLPPRGEHDLEGASPHVKALLDRHIPIMAFWADGHVTFNVAGSTR